MNAADSESLARRMLAAGYVEDSLERADVAILNTGRIVHEGTAAEARGRPELLNAHLGIL